MKKLSPKALALLKLKRQNIELFPYQKRGLSWLLKREDTGIGGLLCDEMGLGKTLQMISLILASRLKNTLLVLPASLLLQWKGQLEKFNKNIQLCIYHGNRTLPVFDNKKTVTLTTYNILINDINILSERKWDRIILDECHYIRNPKSTIFKKIMQISSTKKWGITGTPIQNYLSDIEVLFRFLGYERDHTKLYLDILIRKYIMRRTKQDVLNEHKQLDLPSLTISNINFIIKDQKLVDMYNNISCHPFTQLELILRKKQLSISPQLYLNGISKKFKTNTEQWSGQNCKFDYIVRNIKEQHVDNRIIVFITFNYEIQYLTRKLMELDINVAYINGAVSIEHRKSIIENNDIKVLLVQIECGGTGLNLQNYNIAYFTSLHWNPSLEDQAIARLYRIGQKRKVQIYRVLINKTIDKYIDFVQKRKRKLIKQYIN